MSSTFNTLNIGYSGLNAAKVGIDTIGHNIANAEVEGYTRQRVVTSASTPLSTNAGQVGNGTEVTDIKRVFDNYVFDRYSAISANKEYSDYEQQNLEQLSTYFPEIDGVGIKSDLAEYYNMWQTFADNPDNDAIKVALAEQTETLTESIASTQNKIVTQQKQINEDIVVSVNEVNSIAKELAELNTSIGIAEAGGGYSANDLRDRRNGLERDLSRLIGADVNNETLTSDIANGSSNISSGSYSLSVSGFNIVDGGTYHPIHVSNEKNPKGFYELSYERQDGVLIPMEDEINSGKIGAMLDLRGGTIDSTSGDPVDGTIQNTISQLDAFSKGLIEATNNLYAQNPVTKMQSNSVDIDAEQSLLNSSLNINEGAFDLIVYDIDGNVAAKRTINIDFATTMKGENGSNSIEGQISAQVDDNEDGSANNDIDDFFKDGFSFESSVDGNLTLELILDPLSESQGYTFAIEDALTTEDFSSGSNFAGALGLNRYFDGDDAQSIKLSKPLSDNPTNISAGSSPVSGDNTIALNMVQHQFEEYNFKVDSTVYKSTTNGMFDILATEVGTATNAAITRNETVTTQFNATQLEYFSTTKVDTDEEMTNLIKYQTSYSAAAKIITTIDQMMQTLLGIKR
jgi:flagellar hook-associated protein 1 FlgK